MLLKRLVAPIAGALCLAVSAPALALNPQPLPPLESPHYVGVLAVKIPIHVVPRPCQGPPKIPNTCQ